jgi:hypothetical protein
MAKVKANQFVDEIFWVDILNKINLESEEEEKIQIKIDDWDWTITKFYFDPQKYPYEIRIRCNNHNDIWHLSKTLYKQKLIRKSCWVYLEGTNYHNEDYNKKNIITRNGFEFGGFEIKQTKKKE